MTHTWSSFISRNHSSLYVLAAVKSRPVLHHCVVIFFWSSGIMECTCMLFTFENGVPLNRGCCFLVLAMLPDVFSFHQFNYANKVLWLIIRIGCFLTQLCILKCGNMHVDFLSDVRYFKLDVFFWSLNISSICIWM